MSIGLFMSACCHADRWHQPGCSSQRERFSHKNMLQTMKAIKYWGIQQIPPDQLEGC